MSGPDLLIAFMSIAVAFAGFTGVVALIDRRAAHVSRHVVSFRVRFLIIAVNVVLVLGALPLLLVAFGVPEELAWRISCGALALGGAGYLFGMIRMRSRLTPEQLEGLSAAQFNAIVPPGVLCVVAALVAAAGFIPVHGTYLLGVFYFLMGIASLFLRLVFMLDDSTRDR
ncbi:MAG TPA: hypothetical protein VN932_12565 [Rhizomicrobium sp.]|nr:hypothetical protein [Rhizomicrobium sp.]